MTLNPPADPVIDGIAPVDPLLVGEGELPAPVDPVLKGLLEEAVRAAVKEAVATTPVPTLRPGVVQGVTSTAREVSVLIDGDTAPIVAQSLIDLPPLHGRVMVMFSPPSAVFVVGRIDANSMPAGSIIEFAGPIASDVVSSATTALPPPGWLWCYGQAVNRADWPNLFAVIGTTHNTGGEANTVFRVPDRRGRVAIGIDNMGGSDAGRVSMANTLGLGGGAETHTLVTGNLPSHSHDLANHTHSTPAHSHGAGTYAAANHDHSTPNHSHGFTTAGDGSHNHSFSGVSGDQNANHTHNFSHFISASTSTAAGGDFFAASGWVSSTTTAESATHTHSYSGTTSTVGTHSHGGTTNTEGGSFTGFSAPGVTGTSAFEGSGTSGGPVGNTSGATGSGTAVNHLPPYILTHFIIKG